MTQESLCQNKILRDKGIRVYPNVLLRDYTTFRLGGVCPCLIDCMNPGQLRLAVQEVVREKEDFILIGQGSNLLVSDEGIPSVVIRYDNASSRIERDGMLLKTAGCVRLDEVVLFAVNEGLEGLTYASGIPGTVGGAIAGNAGAFGKQVGDALVGAEILDRRGTICHVGQDYFDFRYRHSRLKESRDIILSATFLFAKAEKKALKQQREEILSLRKQKHPDYKTQPCAGSFFRNIESGSSDGRRQSAGWFLDHAGAKQLHVGGAAVFSRHANIIVKNGPCHAQDVFDLSRVMARAVYEKFHLTLAREVSLVGKFKGGPDNVSGMVW